MQQKVFTLRIADYELADCFPQNSQKKVRRKRRRKTICEFLRYLREIIKFNSEQNVEGSRRYGLDADIHRRHATQQKLSSVTIAGSKKITHREQKNAESTQRLTGKAFSNFQITSVRGK